MKAPLPVDETERLEILRSFAILDTPPEPSFDGIVNLASLICTTPTAIITLVDRQRQWFKARHGFEARETHRDLSFCAHAIVSDDVLVVPDATSDPRFRDNALVTGPPHIRFYAGAPIRVGDGTAVGTVAVLDYKPRELQNDQAQALRELSAQAAAQLELRRKLLHEAAGELRRERDFSDEAIESVPGIFYMIDADGRFRRWNHRFEEVSGYSGAEIGAMKPTDLFAEPDKTRIREAIERTFDQGRAQVEAEIVCRDGHRVPFLLTGRRVESEGEAFLLGVGIDVSDRLEAERSRKELQAQLIHAQKLESLGRLAGGVAHDFNNLLSVIIGRAEFAIEEMPESSPCVEHLLEVHEAARRSSEITRQLLGFARKQNAEPRVLNLNESIEAALKLLQRLVGEEVEFLWRPARDLWPVEADPAQLDQILTNLVVNARDAISEQGTIRLETRNLGRNETNGEVPPEDYVVVAVTDDGCGMDEETQASIFEPFFTTKAHGKGTGLGLATVYGIVTQNHGFIRVNSRPGAGSTFTLYLPRSREQAEAGQEKAGPLPAAAGHETILLVEDEPAVLNLTRRMLERLGYNVLAAESPHEALRLMQEQPRKVDLLMSDVVMPGMNGPELASRLSGRIGSQRRLFMSGYAPEAVAERGALGREVHFLTKPFGFEELALKVRQALGG